MNVSGRRILVFGDSLTHRGSRDAPDGRTVTESSDRDGTPGDLLASHLLELGADKARINGRVSRSAWNLFRVEDGAQVLRNEAAHEPDLVFVFLGTNDLGLDVGKDQQAFETIRDAFAGAEIWAIGPPAFASSDRTKQAKSVYKTLETVFGSSHVIDLRPLTGDVDRTSDGVHFTSGASKVVARRLADAINETGSTVALVRRRWVRPIGISLAVSGLFIGLAWIIRRRMQV